MLEVSKPTTTNGMVKMKTLKKKDVFQRGDDTYCMALAEQGHNHQTGIPYARDCMNLDDLSLVVIDPDEMVRPCKARLIIDEGAKKRNGLKPV